MKIIIRRIVDACMTAGLLLLMSYSLLGEKAHEWIGMAMFSLVILHHILNRLWWKSAGRRKSGIGFLISQRLQKKQRNTA